MAARSQRLQHLVDRAKTLGPLRVAVVDAAQGVVIDTLREAFALGLVEPRLIGDPDAISALCRERDWKAGERHVVSADSDTSSAAKAVELVRAGEADAIMKGNVHTDVLMRALLDKNHGLRTAHRRVSHVFVVEVSSHDKLLGVTDAAINITPDLAAKAQILQNAIDLFHLLGVETPKVAALSAVETVNPEIASTLDAACLTLMAQRGQITGATVDGPLAFDNAISPRAAKEKNISSPVAGDADILLVPDLVAGNILAKNLEYLAGAIAAGVALGLSVPVVLTSRADPAPARLASLALAALVHTRMATSPIRVTTPEPSLTSAPQPEHACCPLSR